MTRALVLTGRLLRAAAGLTAIAALLAGLPWGLARATGSPLPRAWPGWQQARGFFAAPLTDGAIIRVLADAAWLLWAVLAVSLIIEVAAAIRGQPAPRLPAIAPAQALAAALVGATLLTVLHAPKPSPRGAQPLHAAFTSATTISAPLLPGQPAHPATATATAADRAASSGNPNEPRPRVTPTRRCPPWRPPSCMTRTTRVPLPADHAAPGQSGPPRGRPPHPLPPGSAAHRYRRRPVHPDQANRGLTAGCVRPGAAPCRFRGSMSDSA